MSLQDTLRDARRFVFLYGTTPPRADAAPECIERAASRLAARTAELDLDGLVVYDVQDESERTRQPRPFPFLPTLEARTYSQRLQSMAGREIICYKSVAAMSEEQWQIWLDETCRAENGPRCLSLVGRAAASGPSGIPLPQAIREASRRPCGLTLGGVVIPERHRPGRSESERLRAKTEAGCRYFISQAVYAPDAAIRLLQDYAHSCSEQGEKPQRIILTFTPCGSAASLEFMKWLGISIPAETEQAILSSAAPLTESLRVCASNFAQILEAVGASEVPLGVNVESVSIRREEIEASVDLCHTLREVARN